MRLRRETVWVVSALAACGGRAVTQEPPPAPADEVPAGYGTLRRDDIVVQLNAPQVQVQILPLEEGIIRLLRPDAYQALTSLIQSKRAAIDSAAARAGVQQPTLVMVTFRGLVPQARFQPEELNIGNRGQLFRPIGVVPLSTAWSSYQLEAREEARAIYLFDPGISFRERLLVAFQGLVSDSWSRTLSAIDRERAAVQVRASARPPGTPADTTP
jgi:hypothetical protein